MKTIAIMQPYFFPYIGYFQLINAVDKFVFYDDVNYIKQGWVNRNNILLQGQPFTFTIPLKNISSFSKINEIVISELPANWINKLLATFRQAYTKAPYFPKVFPLIEDIITTCNHKVISLIAASSIEKVLAYLSISKDIIPSSVCYTNENLKASRRVIDICKKEAAGKYINAIGGVELYNCVDFKEAGIDLNFLQPVITPYNQFGNKFVGGLSIIDVMMFNSVEWIREQLSLGKIVK